MGLWKSFFLNLILAGGQISRQKPREKILSNVISAQIQLWAKNVNWNVNKSSEVFFYTTQQQRNVFNQRNKFSIYILFTIERLTLFPMGSGYPLFPMGEGHMAPLSKIPENGRLRLKLWIYNEGGLKIQKNPNQFHMNS